MPLTNLRPSFYRVAGTQAVQSGWINTATGDVCDTEDGDHYRIRVLPGAREAFSIGERVEFIAPVELHGGDCILPAERAHVADISDDEGVVDLLLEGFHTALEGNIYTLVPFRTEETLASLRMFKPTPVKACQPAQPSLWWALVIFGYVAPLALALDWVVPPETATLLLGVSIVVTAILLGSSHAIILAMLSVVARNLFIIPPLLHFNVPTVDEYVRSAVWIGMAVVVPWLCQSSERARKVLVRWQGEFKEDDTAARHVED